jgi:hypothetical protein
MLMSRPADLNTVAGNSDKNRRRIFRKENYANASIQARNNTAEA